MLKIVLAPALTTGCSWYIVQKFGQQSIQGSLANSFNRQVLSKKSDEVEQNIYLILQTFKL